MKTIKSHYTLMNPRLWLLVAVAFGIAAGAHTIMDRSEILIATNLILFVLCLGVGAILVKIDYN